MGQRLKIDRPRHVDINITSLSRWITQSYPNSSKNVAGGNGQILTINGNIPSPRCRHVETRISTNVNLSPLSRHHPLKPIRR
jgi:hypothetical protein